MELIAVVKHAYAANRRRHTRDTALVVLTTSSLITCLVLWSTLPLAPFPALVWATVLVDQFVRHRALTRILAGETLTRDTAPDPRNKKVQRLLREISECADGNVTVYGGYKPFIGHGKVVRAWSFALDMKKASNSVGDTKSFTIHELHRWMEQELRGLGWQMVTLEDRVFINGKDLDRHPEFIPADSRRPISSVSDAEMGKYLEFPQDRARPYLLIRAVGWDGQVTLTIFLRLALVQHSLFVEASYSILTPVRPEFQRINGITEVRGLRDLRKLALPSLALAPSLIIDCWRVVSGSSPGMEGARGGQRQARRVESSSNYGAVFSVREHASDIRYQRYFQRLDSQMYTKVIEKRIFDSLVTFLNDHGIDTGELSQRQTTILNSGVLITGGSTVSAGSIAAGPNAQAISGQTQQGGGSSGGSGR